MTLIEWHRRGGRPSVSSLERFKNHLIEREMARATVDKYMRDVARFVGSVQAEGSYRTLTKQVVIAYKASLVERYAPASVNSMLAALNCYLDFIGRPDLKVKHLKVQRDVYRSEERELTRQEYDRLVLTARALGRKRTALVIQTLCATGIRVSELEYVTIEAVRAGRMVVSNKGKIRCVWLPGDLCRALLAWAGAEKIASGPLFRSRAGRPLDRVYLWREMKLVAVAACVELSKVYPHNLRHLFACAYYSKYHDLAALCDLLGHARVETTRIYVATTGKDQRKQVGELGLVA